MALKWLVRFVVVYIVISQVIWNMSWFRTQIVDPYRPVLTWELEHTVSWLGFETFREGSVLYVRGSPIAFSVAQECTGFFGGFFIFLSVVVTLPAKSWPARLKWLLAGAAAMAAANLIRLTFVIALASWRPSTFELVHGLSDIFNMLIGGLVSLLAARYLTLLPRGIKTFGR